MEGVLLLYYRGNIQTIKSKIEIFGNGLVFGLEFGLEKTNLPNLNLTLG